MYNIQQLILYLILYVPIHIAYVSNLLLACGGMMAFLAGVRKNQGVILVELMEMYPDYSLTSLLWIFSLSKLIGRGAGISYHTTELAINSVTGVVCVRERSCWAVRV